jgi:hypothetical protein
LAAPSPLHMAQKTTAAEGTTQVSPYREQPP